MTLVSLFGGDTVLYSMVWRSENVLLVDTAVPLCLCPRFWGGTA